MLAVTVVVAVLGGVLVVLARLGAAIDRERHEIHHELDRFGTLQVRIDDLGAATEATGARRPRAAGPPRDVPAPPGR